MLQPGHVLPAHDPRVEVRQQTRLLDNLDGHGPHVVQGGEVAAFAEPLLRQWVAILRAIAQGEQGLLASLPAPGLGDGHDVVWSEEGLLESGWRLGERAVVAVVPAEHRQGHEHLAGVGDGRTVAQVAEARRNGHELGQSLPPGVEERFGLIE